LLDEICGTPYQRGAKGKLLVSVVGSFDEINPLFEDEIGATPFQ
jgi:hypothetical protein